MSCICNAPCPDAGEGVPQIVEPRICAKAIEVLSAKEYALSPFRWHGGYPSEAATSRALSNRSRRLCTIVDASSLSDALNGSICSA